MIDHSHAERGQFLRDKLDAIGKPPKWFAEQMGIDYQTLNNWFKRGVPHKNRLQAARVLGCDQSYFNGGVDLASDHVRRQAGQAISERALSFAIKYDRLNNAAKDALDGVLDTLSGND